MDPLEKALGRNSRQLRWLFWIVLAAPLVIGLGYLAAPAFFFAMMLHSGCSHDLVNTFPSPRGDLVAKVYVTNCGATTSFVASVTVEAKEHPLDPATTLRAGRDFFRVQDRGDGIEVVWPDQVIWRGVEPVTVVYPSGTRILRQAIKWDGLEIEYREK